MRGSGIVVLLLGAAACGPDNYEDFRAQLVDRTCGWAVRCGYAPPGDRAACPVDALLALFGDATVDRAADGAYDVAGSIDAGRVRYDSVNAGGCLDAVEGAPCDLDLASARRKRACNAVVAPHVQTDGTCWTDFECTGGICARAPGCAGSCIPYASFGAPCLDVADAPVASRCDPTVGYCAPSTPGVDPTCQRKKPAGADCNDSRECRFGWLCRQLRCIEATELPEGAACGGNDPCKEGTFCDPNTLLCGKQGRSGEACVSPTGCEDGLACVGLVPVMTNGAPEPVVTAGVCAPWLPVGASCTQGSADAVTGCPQGARCADGACRTVEDRAALGESCADRPCRDGLGCDARVRCDYLRAILGDCAQNRAPLCRPGLACSGAADGSARCVPPDAPACFVADGV